MFKEKAEFSLFVADLQTRLFSRFEIPPRAFSMSFISWVWNSVSLD
jgi:hypothetical protein